MSGIVMVSPLIEGGLTFGGRRFALGAALQLPSLAAAELERKGAFSKEAQAEAERFALTDYLTTLAGPPPQGDAARSFYARVAKITGLPEDVVARVARLHPRRLCQASALRRGQDRQPLRRDLRGRRSVPGTGERARRPIRCSTASPAPMARAFAAYARDELGFKTEMTYILLASDICRQMGLGRRRRARLGQRQRRLAGTARAHSRRSACSSRTATATW